MTKRVVPLLALLMLTSPRAQPTGQVVDASSRLKAEAAAYPQLQRLPPAYDVISKTSSDRFISSSWHPRALQAGDPAAGEPQWRRQLSDAACAADQTVVARVLRAAPFLHPHGRWILTRYELETNVVYRGRQSTSQMALIHPSGALSIEGKLISTVIDRYPLLQIGQTYLFFLSPIEGSDALAIAANTPIVGARGGQLAPDEGRASPGVDGALKGIALGNVKDVVAAVPCK
jgi:hypothetical protein